MTFAEHAIIHSHFIKELPVGYTTRRIKMILGKNIHKTVINKYQKKMAAKEKQND